MIYFFQQRRYFYVDCKHKIDGHRNLVAIIIELIRSKGKIIMAKKKKVDEGFSLAELASTLPNYFEDNKVSSNRCLCTR